MLDGAWDEMQSAAFLLALRMKGENAEELGAAAQCVRNRMTRLFPKTAEVLDTCGTGGDGSGTFNISTAAAIVAAAAGVPVVKHGNRAVSSRTGSADVLTALGIELPDDADAARSSLERLGFAFCFAPSFHPALKRIGPLRKRLGVRTTFNLLGPLLNPANAAFQLLGVGKREMLEPMAGALAGLGIQRAYVVSGHDGLDEVSLSGPTSFCLVQGGAVTSGSWNAADFGLAPCSTKELAAADASESARIIESVLQGVASAASRIVTANAAVALLAAGRCKRIGEGVAIIEDVLRSGRGMQMLERLRGKALN